MKGLILAGGTGSRLRPLTHTTQKQLLPVANRPVLDYVVEDLRNAGVTDIGVVLGNTYPDQIQSHLGDGTQLGVEITYIHQGEPLGLAHAVGCAANFVGEEPFIVYFGDTLIDNKITSKLVETFDSTRYTAALCLQQVDNPSRFGIVDVDDDGNIQRILEKPESPPTDLAYIGVLAFTSTVFDVIENLEPSWRGELELTDALDGLIAADEPVQWIEKDGLWKDVGTPTDLIAANRIMLNRANEEPSDRFIPANTLIEGPAELDRGSIIQAGASVEGPSVLAENVTVGKGARIGPHTSVGDNVTVQDTFVKSSVVLEDVKIDGGPPLVECIIGPRTKILRQSRDSRCDTEQQQQFIVGPDTTIRR